MSGNGRTGADALVEGLADAGVKHVFGLPGDTGVDLYDSLSRAAPHPIHIMCRDERHAVIMADVYARCTNELGVVEVSSGGGVSYAIGGMGEAFASSIPLLLISSDIHASSRGTGALTELDQERLFSGVTKWVRRAERAADVPALLVEAIVTATSDRPAPVALILPENVLAEHTEARASSADVSVPARRLPGDVKAIAMIASKLMEAERPAILVGGGIHSSAAYEELAELAEIAAVPVATTIHGKGAYPESGPWSLGVVGANGARPYANDYLADADFVLLVGTRANATDTNSFRCPPKSTGIAQIDICPERACRNFPDGIRLVADAKSALARLTGEVRGKTNGRSALRNGLEELRGAWRCVQPPWVPAGRVHPLAVFSILRSVFGADALTVADCGTATPYLAAHWETGLAGRRLVVARGHGPMGYAIPGAVGAAIANPGTRVLAITTDGSLGMACGELETVARLNLPITFVQLTNGSFGWIKMLQHLYHERRYFGVDLGTVDSCGVATAFGVPGIRVDSETAFREALAAHHEAGPGPSFIEVMVPDMVDLEPPVASWTAALSGSETERPVY